MHRPPAPRRPPAPHESVGMPSPKRKASGSEQQSVYEFYAGFSQAFATRVLSATCKPGESLALDPWNGAGTTTAAARTLGVSYAGYDLNPVMVVVARSQEYQPASVAEVLKYAKEVLRSGGHSRQAVEPGDPLLAWFTPNTVGMLRGFFESVILTRSSSDSRAVVPAHLEPRGCFLLVAIFRALRSVLGRFRTTNPAWLRVPVSTRARLRTARGDFRAAILREVAHLAPLVAAQPPLPAMRTLGLSPSTAIPLPAATVDVVVSSPPYCTRIDYAMATRAELALLGYSPSNGLRDLRREMIGTPTIASETPKIGDAWGTTCTAFLETVRCHDSKASATYYLKTHVQYFDRLFRSLGEIHRVLKPTGQCVLVVQDSYYKDVHNDLAQVVCEMVEHFGWVGVSRQDFPVQRLLTKINPRARTYRAVPESTESVLWFKAK